MDQIRWLETPIEQALASELSDFDHYRVDIEGDPAVLITYIRDIDPDRGLLAVFHPAAALHPRPPDWVNDVVGGLPWTPCTPPSVS